MRILCFKLRRLQTCTCLFNEFFYLTAVASVRKLGIKKARFNVIWHRHMFKQSFLNLWKSLKKELMHAY